MVRDSSSADTLHLKHKLKLVSIPQTQQHRKLSCYFFDFEARFFNSKLVSNAFVDMLRATYVFRLFRCEIAFQKVIFLCSCNTPTQMPRMILSFVFDPDSVREDHTFDFLAAGLASRLIHPLWTFVISPPPRAGVSPKLRLFHHDSIKGNCVLRVCYCVLNLSAVSPVEFFFRFISVSDCCLQWTMISRFSNSSVSMTTLISSA